MFEFIGFLVVCYIGLVVIKAVYNAWAKGNLVNSRDSAIKNEILHTINLFASEVSFISSQNIVELTEICTHQFYNRISGEENFTVFDIFFNSLTGRYLRLTIDGTVSADVSLRSWQETDRFLRNNPTYSSELTAKLLSFWSKILIDKGVDPFNFEFSF
ncbi:hypothetical protein [Rheinheimera tilapiae]|uniref:DUF4760 domain-containing protein n=1 Tax=Rheinheimera tilapiae TaxID=875043 RepID=A0ABV6B8J5_9GAMM